MRDLDLSRREVLKAGVCAGAGALTGPALAPSTVSANPARPGGLRFVHLTDMHVQPERRGGEGYAAALQAARGLHPAFLVTGGDHVMDATGQGRHRAELQWDLYERVLRENVGPELPVHPVLGNHDVWGWGVPEVSDAEAGYGKAMALDRLRFPSRSAFHSFDAGGWHFVVLDSVARRDKGYFAALGDEQLEWLKGDLAAAGSDTPVCVFSHIPILAACVFFDGERLRPDHWNVPDAWMHRDAAAILAALEPYNVRLLVSGHIHLVDRVDYRNRTFVCDGAICGAWWKGPYQQFGEGFGVFDLWPDGSFEHRYAGFDWHVAPEDRA